MLNKYIAWSIPILLFFTVVTAHAVSAVATSPADSVKQVALTFDDGPYGTSTAKILAILEREHVHGTFFLIGKNVEKYPALAKRIVDEGNIVGNHTYDHPRRLNHFSDAQFEQELSLTESAIISSTGVHATLFRPPYGVISEKMRGVLAHDGYRVVMWNVDPWDWNYLGSPPQKIVNVVLAHLKPQMIIILHDGRAEKVDYPRDNTILALPVIIETLRSLGYTFVTADQLPMPFAP